MLRSAALMQDDIETIAAATDLLAEAKLSPELQNEALYFRGKAYLAQRADKKAMNDFQTLAKDTRTLYGAEAKYLVALQLYHAEEYTAAEKRYSTSSNRAHRMPTGWHAASYSLPMCTSQPTRNWMPANTC